VANIIPPQRAAAIARTAGLDDGKGWCRVQARTFESIVHAGIPAVLILEINWYRPAIRAQGPGS
jgi:hypothetical protein